MSYQIRPAKQGEANHLLNVVANLAVPSPVRFDKKYLAAFEAAYLRPTPQSCVCVAIPRGQTDAVGLIQYRSGCGSGATGQISNLYVVPAHQGRGVALQLKDRAFLALDLRRNETKIDATPAGQRTFQHHGFSATSNAQSSSESVPMLRKPYRGSRIAAVSAYLSANPGMRAKVMTDSR